MMSEDNKQTEDNSNPEDQAAEENVVNMADATASNQELSPEDQIAKLQEELIQARDRTMRALADAENTRRRALKDRDDAGKYAVSNFARDLLDFSDNFKRALESMPEDTPPAVAEGLNAMRTELLNTFERHGIRKIEPLDEPFDANFHEVMFEAPSPDKQAGTIIQVIEAGYVLNDRLLRAAKVGIAKAGDQNTDPGAKVDIEG
jgi:molecular chaperone GrpE